MIIRFTKKNWGRFFTHGKKTTFRVNLKKVGHYTVYGGSRYKPIMLGELDITKVEAGRKFSELTEQDVLDEGFDTLAELKTELKRLNKVTAETQLYKHQIENVMVVTTR